MTNKKVLLVEDNDLNIILFKDLLEIKDLSVFVAKDFQSFSKLISTIKPDLILMDIQLQDCSGFELIKQLKEHKINKQIPIIAVTAFASKKDKEKILKAGCEAYIAKPVSVDNFFETIAKFV